jgi:hypothetical protein
MAVELGPAGDLLRGVIGRVLYRRESPEPSLSLSSERARGRRKAYEREGVTYVGNIGSVSKLSVARVNWD